MLDYTKAAFNKIFDDFKKLRFIINIIAQIVYILYLVYALIAPTGNAIANAILLALSVAYFILFLSVSTGKIDKAKKRLQKTAKRIFKHSKLAVKAFTLGITVYGLFSTAKNMTPFSLLFTVFMLVGWVLQVVFDIVFHIVGTRFELLVTGLEADIEMITKPAKTVGNFFKKIAGKEVEPEKEPTQQRLWLDDKVKETRAEKAEKRRLEKEEKRQAKRDRKNTRFYTEQAPVDEPIEEEYNKVFETEYELAETTAPEPAPSEKKRFWQRKTK